MENLETTNQRIAKNLIYYRKAANLTQAELAQKINYSDKSVSKWESGNGVPDIYILLKLAELYGITVNDLVSERSSAAPPKRMSKWRHILIMLLSSGIVWLVATVVFVFLNIVFPKKGEWWLAFLYAVPINAIVITSLAAAWKYKITNFVAVSLLIWDGARRRICHLESGDGPSRTRGLQQAVAAVFAGRAASGAGDAVVLLPLVAVQEPRRGKER